MNLDFLKQKKFGLPVWAWVGISAVLIFGIYYYIKKRQGSTSSNSSTDPTASTPDNSNVPLSTLPFGDPGSGASSFFSPPTPNSVPPIIVELQQQPNTTPNGGSTTPPPNPSQSLSGATAIPATSIGQAASSFLNSPGGIASNEPPSNGVISDASTIKGISQIEAMQIGSQPPVKTVNSTKTIPNSVFQPVKPAKSSTRKPLY